MPYNITKQCFVVEGRMLISKKDLLIVTGISYGQLYRWKREGLIPEEWFIKKSSYTGQETFFPKEQAISRIRIILDLKDTYSLEEMAEIFAKGSVKIDLDESSARKLGVIHDQILREYLKKTGENRLGFQELVYLAALSPFGMEGPKDLEGIYEIIRKVEPMGKKLLCFRLEDSAFYMVIQEGAEVEMDRRATFVGEADLGKIADQLKLAIRKINLGKDI